MRNRRSAAILMTVFAVIMACTMTISTAGAAETTPKSNIEKYGTALVDMDLLSGMGGDDNLGMNLNVTREQAITMILSFMDELNNARALESTEAENILAKYPDASKISSWARNFVAYATKNGYVGGRTDGTYDPAGNVKGYEFGIMMLNTMGFAPGTDYVPVNSLEFLVQQELFNNLKAECEYLRTLEKETITRGDCMAIMYGALGTARKDTGITQIQTLINKGRLTEETVTKNFLKVNKEKDTLEKYSAQTPAPEATATPSTPVVIPPTATPTPIPPTVTPTPTPSSGIELPADPFTATPTPTPAATATPIPTATPTPSTGSYTGAGYVVGYYPYWEDDIDIDATKYTHMMYAFSVPDSNLVPFPDTRSGRSRGAEVDSMTALKQQNPNLKLILSVGGWGGSDYFTTIAATSTRRTAFAENYVAWLVDNGWDGLDIDWEFPDDDETTKYTQLIKEIRRVMDEQEAKDGKHYSLSLAGDCYSYGLDGLSIDFATVEKYFDFVFIMGYNVNSYDSRWSYFNSPYLSDSEHRSGSLVGAVESYLAVFPANKVVLGLPSYGHIFRVASADQNGLNQELVDYSKAGEISYSDVVTGYLSQSGYTRYYNETAKSCWLFNPSTRIFISYDDPDTIYAKAQLARDYNLAGVGTWEVSQDYNNQITNALYKAIKGL